MMGKCARCGKKKPLLGSGHMYAVAAAAGVQ